MRRHHPENERSKREYFNYPDPNALAQIVKLDDNQVRLILNQLARAKAVEDA